MRIAAGSYTNSKARSMKAWVKKNKDKVKENKRKWRDRQKEICPNCNRKLIECNGNCIFDGLPNKGF